MASRTDHLTWSAYFDSVRSFTLVCVLLCISTFVFRANAKVTRQAKLGARAPAVPSRSPLGFDVCRDLIRNLRTNTILEWHQKILSVPGQTVEINVIGISMIVTDNIENIRAIMSTQFDSFGKGETYHKIWSSMLRDSILTTDGEAWQINRSHLIAHTARIRPTDYAVTERHAQNLIRVLSDGQPHDMLDQLNRFAIDVVSDIFYDTSTHTLLTNDQSLRDAIQMHKNMNTWRLLFGKLGARIPPNRKACDIIEKYLDNVVQTFSLDDSENQEQRDRKTHTLLGALSAQGVSEKVMKDQLVAVLVGGRDSIAITVTWALYKLVRHTSILRELREEIERAIGGNDPPSATQLEKLEFLNGVVKETMRFHASVGINTRTALKDCSLPTGGGPTGTSPIGILAASTLVMALDSVHRRSDTYGSDANDFNPHRWDNGWKPDTWTFYPFNRGTRVCLGKNLAVMEVKFVLCRLVQAFSSIELVEKVNDKVVVVDAEQREKIKTKMAFNTKPAEVVWLQFRK